MASTITIKDDYIFLVSDTTGDVLTGSEGYGLYSQDMRYLSHLELTIDGKKPQFLSYDTDYNIAATFQLSSTYLAQLPADEHTLAPQWGMVSHAIGLSRQRFIRRGLIEKLELTNFHSDPVKLTLGMAIGADFADIFEVRGFEREMHGPAAKIRVSDEGQTIVFESIPKAEKGLKPRFLRFECDQKPSRYEEQQAISTLNGRAVPEICLYFELELQPHQLHTINFDLLPEPEQTGTVVGRAFESEVNRAREVFSNWKQVCTGIRSDNYELNRIFEVSILDLRSLMQQEPHGLVVTAGLPWYFTLFGRDSLITAIQTLSLNPQIAIDTMRSLAELQATELDDWRDSEPGKILHEMRKGDMALGEEVPHRPYYGSVDSTILYILCFAETMKWVGDIALFTELWPSVEKALSWCYNYGELDGDGYIKYKRRSAKGILHQGWKDSDESMGGPFGPRPSQPLALVEVQGYYYAAKIALAQVLRQVGNTEQKQLAEKLDAEAARLKENFNRDFWWEEENFLAQALDAEVNLVRNITSNPGHCLWSGIVEPDKAAKVAARLVQPDLLSGWGIRTMSAKDITYNPMSYHNGSIWPHDNALAVAGLRRYGFDKEALMVANQLFEAATTFEEYRLPELYCGFARQGATERAPAAYPVSCSPQAWAAGTSILLLQTLLGLEANAFKNELKANPLPFEGTNEVFLRGVRLGNRRLNLSFRREPSGRVIVSSNQES